MNAGLEIWRCSHVRKCKWEGLKEELHAVLDKKDPMITHHVCPRCGNDDFYVAREGEAP